MESEPRKRKTDDMMIEGQRRKEDKHQRHHLKAGQVEDDVEGQYEDDEEEEKMEKFFALIRSTRDMRDRMLRRSLASIYHEVPTTSSSSSSFRDQIQADHQNKVEEGRGSSAMALAWNPPSFQPEDFLEGSHDRQPGPSKTEEDHDDNQGKKKGKDEGDCVGLDLNLSL